MKRKIGIIFGLFTLALSTINFTNEVTVEAASINLATVMEAKTYNDTEISSMSLPYRIYVPSNYDVNKEYKLMFMLHGAGERGNDNLAPINLSTGMVYAKNIISDPTLKEEFIILVPQCPANNYWVDYTITPGYFDIDYRVQTIPSKLAASLLFDTIKNYSIDMSRIYITGISMGGYGTWDFISRYPGLFAGAIPMCGGCDPSKYEEASLTPIWAFCSKDDTTVPCTKTKEMIDKLQSIGAGALYTEYDGIGHDSWIPGYQNENAFYWLISQQRKNIYYTTGKKTITETLGNIATKGTPIVSYIDPQYGIGSHSAYSLSDGIVEINREEFNSLNKDSWAWMQVDTYGLNKPNDVYFGYEFADEYDINALRYQTGRYFMNGGGWFSGGVKVQAKIDDEWVDVTLTNDPGYPNVAPGVNIDTNTNLEFGFYDFKFNTITCKGIRIYGAAGGSQYFSSCAELEVSGIKHQINEPEQEVEEIKYVPKTNKYTDEYILDSIKGAYIGQMVGVVWGAPTEFATKEGLIPDNKIPNINQMNFNDAFIQDDLYVEIPFIDALMKEGLDCSVEKMGEYFEKTTFPLWHGNDVARTNLSKGIKAPDSGSYQYNSCCEDIDWQIESDFVGMMSPGMVNVASNYGFEWGHVIGYADGAYGGAYVSAMHAKAYTAENITSIIISGIKSIPEGSKFRQVLDDILYWYQNDVCYEDCFKMLNSKWLDDDRCPREGFGGQAPFNIDAKLNAGYCLMGMLYGDNDFEEIMRLAMKCGQDSDCNPSTVGSIVAGFLGYEALDNLYKNVDFTNTKFSYTDYSLNDAIDAIFELSKQNATKNGIDRTDNIWTINANEEIEPLELEVWEPMPSIEYTLLQTNKTIVVNTTPYYEKGIKSVNWDFGDGSNSSSASATHNYLRTGEYTLTLTVIGKDDTVATRIINLNIFIDNNIAGEGTPITSQKSPTGSGSKDINVIIDGTIANSSAQQYDTYYQEGAPAHEDYFGVTFDEIKNIYMISYYAGCYFNNGGWFENIKVQALVNDSWIDITLTNDPGYPNATSQAGAGKEYARYDFTFDNIACKGIRVIGNAGGSAHFSSCSELKVYAVSNASFDEENKTFYLDENDLVISFNLALLNVEKVKLNGNEISNDKYTITDETITFTVDIVSELFTDNNELIIELENSKQIACSILVVPIVKNVEIDYTNVKKTYYINEELDLSNLIVKAIYANKTQVVNKKDYVVETNYDSSEIGKYNVVIKYLQFDSASFDVTVKEDALVSLEINKPFKTAYKVGETISFEGLIVYANFESGKKEQVTNYAINDTIKQDKTGTYTILVTYKNSFGFFNVVIEEDIKEEVKEKGCKSSIIPSILGLLTIAEFLIASKKRR